MMERELQAAPGFGVQGWGSLRQRHQKMGWHQSWPQNSHQNCFPSEKVNFGWWMGGRMGEPQLSRGSPRQKPTDVRLIVFSCRG